MIEKQEQITTIITEALMHKHLLFSAIIDSLAEFTYRDILLSWGELREEGLLKIDPEGLYYLEK